MDLRTFADGLAIFCFGYPFVMAWYWMAGGLLYRFVRERHEPTPDSPPPLPEYPGVSILVPCFNEERQLEETFAVLAAVDYPAFEIVAVDDGSTDRTAAMLDELARRIPQLRVVHLERNQGKSSALNVGALLAKHEVLVCIDGDALLDRHAVTWFVRRFQSDARLGALTGNPRIRNRASVLGRLQVGEFSSIVGLIKRAQTLYGRLFTISGVICAFRKRALDDAGWWAPGALTDDVEATWRVQLAGWRVVFEPKALCWILMPETLRGLWRQRLRWSEGGTQTVLLSTGPMFRTGAWRLFPVWFNYMVSIAWSYAMILGFALWLASSLAPAAGQPFGVAPLPSWWGSVLALTYLVQAVVSVSVDERFEKGVAGSIFWIIWYPLAFWILQAASAAVGFPRAILRPRHARGTWISPDRGIR
jgi:biofilm PGA synthesis N-glycosyltransferase PgaC